MSSNPEFQKINSQRKILVEMEQEQADLRAKVEARNAEISYDELKSQVNLLIFCNYNRQLSGIKITATIQRCFSQDIWN